jgi:hypothetical protein
MVYVDGGGSPKKIHENFNDANEEAYRLAKSTGRDTFILQTTSYYSPLPPVLIPLKLELESGDK